MKRFHLTGSQNFYGIKDPKTYYDVPGHKVLAGVAYMCETFNLDNVFIYEKGTIGENRYICAYSRKYQNFRYPGGFISKVFNH